MIQRRPFGRTGHVSSTTLFGAAALARASQDDADRALEVLLRHRVNHIDTAARYGDSELRIGPWMARHRKDFFLATKTGSRTGNHRISATVSPTSGFAPAVCGANAMLNRIRRLMV